MDSYETAYQEMVESMALGRMWVCHVHAYEVLHTWIWQLSVISMRAAMDPRDEVRILFMLELIARGRRESCG